jgi:MFS family permease
MMDQDCVTGTHLNQVSRVAPALDAVAKHSWFPQHWAGIVALVEYRVTGSVNPERPATVVQGWVLIMCGWLAVMASQVIAPVLPTVTAEFKNTAHVDALIAFVATGQSLFVALLAPLFGLLGDRIGHKRVLCSATLLYGAAGTAPLWLPNLQTIAASRAVVGIAESAAMTCSVALIGVYFRGRSRERYLALQTGTASLVAILVNAVGGALGDGGWRYPFAVYAFAFVLTPLTALLLWESKPHGKSEPAAGADDEPAFRWGKLLWICLATAFGMTAFLLIVVQTGFLLTERGMTSPGAIGRWTSVAMLASPVGSLLFALLPWRPAVKLTLTFVAFGAGFFVVALIPLWQATVIGAAIAYVGAGMVLPTTIAWGLADLPAAQRGRGTGAWVTATFVGQFLGPLCILGLRTLTGSLSMAVAVYAVACTATAALIALIAIKQRGAGDGPAPVGSRPG